MGGRIGTEWQDEVEWRSLRTERPEWRMDWGDMRWW